MNATHDIAPRIADGWARALSGAVVGLVTGLCVILFEISEEWWGADGARGVLGWAITAAMLAVALGTEFWLLLASFRLTGLKLNNNRLNQGAWNGWRHYFIVIAVACVMALASVILFHQMVPILPFESWPMLVAFSASGFPLEFADLKANHAYWLEKLKEINGEEEAQT